MTFAEEQSTNDLPLPPPEQSECQINMDASQMEATSMLPMANGMEGYGDALTARNMEQLLEQQEMMAAEADSVELLRNVFDSMATNGKITMDQLPFVLVGAEVQASAKEIEEAIEEHIPDADDADALLDFHQVECLYQQLAHNASDMVPVASPQLQEQVKPAFWVRLWQFIQRRRHQHQNKEQRTAYEKHMKPTTRLLLMILACACTLCVSVVVFAIAFIWVHSSNTVTAHIKRSAKLVKDGLYLFGYEHPFENYDINTRRAAMLLGVVVEQLGYQDTMRILKETMVYEQKLLIDFLDGWFAHDSRNTVSTNVMLAKGWLENLHLRRGETAAIAMVDRINAKLPEGHEILIGRWDVPSQTVRLYCKPRYSDQCKNGACIIANEAMVAAVFGQTNTVFTNDYRPHPVVAGYTYLNVSNLGLVYKVDQEKFQAEFFEPMRTIVDEINEKSIQAIRTGTNSLDRQNSQEVVLAKTSDGQTEILSALRDCDSKCLQGADLQSNLITLALKGQTGVNETTDFNGEDVIMAYSPFEYAGLALSIKTAREEFFDGVYVGLGDALNAVNDVLYYTSEVQFGTISKSQGNSSKLIIQFHTQFRFPEDCVGDCGSAAGSSAFMRKAIVDCEWGVMSSEDYRGKEVTAGYACIPSLHGGLVMKVDHDQVIAEGVAMVGTIGTYQNDVRYKDKTVEIAVAKKKPGVEVVHNAADQDRVTKQRFADQCPNSTCTGSDVLMQRALAKETGSLRGPDYRDVTVLGAYDYIPGLEVGVVVKLDVTEAERKSLELALQLAGCTIGAVLVSMVVLAVLANILLKTMDRTWEEGKRAIEREKQQFCNVITAMYPPQVAKRMLVGETQIVYNVANASVFFSDIYEFTAASNTITPEQLIQFLGYTFGVMDCIAEHHHIYKVKTIGDAYLAVSGLPGSESLNGNCLLDMMLFASCCAQLFGNRFLHPEEGAILDMVAKNLFGRKKQVKMAEGPESQFQSPSGATAGGATTGKAPLPAALLGNEPFIPQVHCTMRYGVSTGPIAAGVLQGKTPLFDIWGRTVNLASRMESTGQPGRIQVTEAVYQAITGLKGQPFTFETRHKVFCKGFGNVTAYFVNTCSVAPSKELLINMHIEPNFGNFYFDNPVPGFKGMAKGGVASSNHDSSHASSHDQGSVHSSVVSGQHIRVDAVLRV